MKRSPIKRRSRTKHQERNEEHREYVQWVHTQPCAACGTRQNIQAAHVGRGGTGMKHGSDAEAIPLCGPHGVADIGMITNVTYCGCHVQHDEYFGRFRWPRLRLRAWDELQIAVHRGRFEARNVRNEDCPF